MTDNIYRAIAESPTGFVEAPAGCGKTEAIVRTVGDFCQHPQLVLTHTHAGVDVLRRRFRDYQIPSSKYHVDTIAGWSWGWVRRYPLNAIYQGAVDIADWSNVYVAMIRLLEKEFVRSVILNSYSGIIVDEYQDCTVPMHQLIGKLKNILPCRVLGDPLQGVFGFNEPLVNWADVESEFGNNIGVLNTPYRWLKVENEPLGRWLIDTRPDFQRGQEPDFNGSPIQSMSVSNRELAARLISLTHAKSGRICVIGPKNRGLSKAIETTLVNKNYTILESNELSVLRILIEVLTDGTANRQSIAALAFLEKAYSSLGTDKTFIEKILKGESQRPARADRKILCEKYSEGTTPQLLRDLLDYIEQISGITCKLRDSVSALKCILEQNIDSGVSLKALYADEVSKRKYQSRSGIFRCVGSTLLVKGLEFDHAIILRGQSWGTHNDLYVALTRGSRSVTLIDVTT